jgi:hypothetical protein
MFERYLYESNSYISSCNGAVEQNTLNVVMRAEKEVTILVNMLNDYTLSNCADYEKEVMQASITLFDTYKQIYADK